MRSLLTAAKTIQPGAAAIAVALIVSLAACGSSAHVHATRNETHDHAKRPSWQAVLVRRAGKTPLADGLPHYVSALRSSTSSIPPAERLRAMSTLGPGAPTLGLRFGKANILHTRLGVPLWVVTGRGVVCIFDGRSFAAGCDTQSETARLGLDLVVDETRAAPGSKRPPVTALGIAPDSARAARFKLVAGGTRTVRVIHNAFALRARTPMALVKLIR